MFPSTRCFENSLFCFIPLVKFFILYASGKLIARAQPLSSAAPPLQKEVCWSKAALNLKSGSTCCLCTFCYLYSLVFLMETVLRTPSPRTPRMTKRRQSGNALFLALSGYLEKPVLKPPGSSISFLTVLSFPTKSSCQLRRWRHRVRSGKQKVMPY